MTAAGDDQEYSLKLPEPRYDGGVSFEKALLRRRSVRNYADEPLTLPEVSQLLWAAQGFTDSIEGFRTAPSAGALYPLELYLIAGRVSDLPAGIYHYLPRTHALRRVAEGDKRKELARASLGQLWIAEAPVVLVLSAVYERTTGRYWRRGIRYVDMEAGHAAQNVFLEADALGLASCAVGAFSDSEVKQLMGRSEAEVPLYILPVGRPAG